jgi:hypothetical protein
VFDEATARVGAELGEVVRTFVRRDELTLEAFGWSLADSPAGPEYSWTGDVA